MGRVKAKGITRGKDVGGLVSYDDESEQILEQGAGDAKTYLTSHRAFYQEELEAC